MNCVSEKEVKQNTHSRTRFRINAETLFFVAYAILLIKALITTSTIRAYIPYKSFLFANGTRFIAYLLILIKFFSTDKFSAKSMAYTICFVCLMAVSFLINRYGYLIDMTALIVGARGVKFKKIAEILGGIVLILLGVKFLLEGYNIISLGF